MRLAGSGILSLSNTPSHYGGCYINAIDVVLSCNDGLGSGCEKTYYTTDGSNPTTASSVYTGPISISSKTILKFFSTDLNGNVEEFKGLEYEIGSPPENYADGFVYPVGSPDGIGWNHGQNCINTYPNDTCPDGYDFLEWAVYPAGGVWHPGEDWNIDHGDDFQKPVHAIGQGKVRASIDQDVGGFGKVVLIEHQAKPGCSYILADENGPTGLTVGKAYSLYAHLDSIEPDIVYGNEIEGIETIIGKVGTTGNVSSHLHFEIRYKTFNPTTCLYEDPSTWDRSTWEAFAQKAWCGKANSIPSVKNYFVDPWNFINANKADIREISRISISYDGVQGNGDSYSSVGNRIKEL